MPQNRRINGDMAARRAHAREATLYFALPEERLGLDAALHAEEFIAGVVVVDQWLRSKVKYGEGQSTGAEQARFDARREAFEEARTVLREALGDLWWLVER